MTSNEVWKAQGRRLRQARIRSGFESALTASEHLGLKTNTYRNHERGTRNLAGLAERYATAFGVSPEWLLWGRDPSGDVEATRSSTEPAPAVTRRRAMVSGEAKTVPLHVVTQPSGRLEPERETIELPAGAPLDAEVIVVRGQGLRPTYDDGMVLLYWNREVHPRSAVGANCMVALRGGPHIIARLELGPRPEAWALFHVNGTGVITYEAKVEWAAPIELVLRSSRWHEVWPRDPLADD